MLLLTVTQYVLLQGNGLDPDYIPRSNSLLKHAKCKQTAVLHHHIDTNHAGITLTSSKKSHVDETNRIEYGTMFEMEAPICEKHVIKHS